MGAVFGKPQIATIVLADIQVDCHPPVTVSRRRDGGVAMGAKIAAVLRIVANHPQMIQTFPAIVESLEDFRDHSVLEVLLQFVFD